MQERIRIKVVKNAKNRRVPNSNIVDVGGGGDCFWRVVSSTL